LYAALFSSLSIVCIAGTLQVSTTDASSDVALVDSLRHIGGEYRWDSAANRYLFTKKEDMERILALQDETTGIQTLANCIDDPRKSDTTLGSKRVALGILCYEALTQLIYYEPTNPNGDIARDWIGYIVPNASIQQLRSAKRAWIKVIKSGSYKRL